VDGLDAEDIVEIGTHMGFHPLIQEDIVRMGPQKFFPVITGRL
jgi:hypothetical protein